MFTMKTTLLLVLILFSLLEMIQCQNTDAGTDDSITEAVPTEAVPTEVVPLAEISDDNTLSIWITLFSLVIVLVIVGNVCIIIVVLRDKTTRKKQSNVFFLSLLISRTSVAIFVMPARITGLFSNELLGSTLCKLCHYAGRGSAVTSVMSTVAIALAKYHQVTTHKHVAWKTTLKQLVMLWIVGYLWAIRAAIVNDLLLLETGSGLIWACTADPQYAVVNTVFIFIDMILLFLIPLIIILICYIKLIKILNKTQVTETQDIKHKEDIRHKEDMHNQDRHNRDRHNRDKHNQDKHIQDTEHNDDKKKKAHMNTVLMLLAIMCLFTVCYSAPYIFHIYVYFNNINVMMADFAEIERIVYWVSYSNPWLNIFVYIAFREDIRIGLKKLFCGKKRRKVKHMELNKIQVDENLKKFTFNREKQNYKMYH